MKVRWLLPLLLAPFLQRPLIPSPSSIQRARDRILSLLLLNTNKWALKDILLPWPSKIRADRDLPPKPWILLNQCRSLEWRRCDWYVFLKHSCSRRWHSCLATLDAPWHRSMLESEAPRPLPKEWEASHKCQLLWKIFSVSMVLPTAYSLTMPKFRSGSEFMISSASTPSKIFNANLNTNIKTLLNTKSATSPNGPPVASWIGLVLPLLSGYYSAFSMLSFYWIICWPLLLAKSLQPKKPLDLATDPDTSQEDAQ